MRFRDDINGLRAVAVIAVVLFHFKSSLLPAGFAGVDVFFVISGYLMTSAIFPKVVSGSFFLRDFYVSRVRRLVPALVALCAVLLFWGYFSLLPIDYKQLGKHVVGALFFFSNFIFHGESGYFDSSSHLKWLLHTWSLSVEWQFYMIYPLLIMGVVKLFGARCGKGSIALLAALSFVFAVWASYALEGFAYYMLPTRAWEMMAGGLVFLYPSKMRGAAKASAALLGLLSILCSFLFLDSNMAWPGLWTLVPVIGTCLVIAAGCTGSILSENAVVSWLGKTSYSTYLWHWPICVYLYGNGLSQNAQAVAFGIVLSFVCGFVSYVMVENVAVQRRAAAGRSHFSSRLKLPVAVFVFLFVFVSGCVVVQSNGAVSRMAGEIKSLSEITNVYEHFDFKKAIRYGTCHSVIKEVSLAHCIEHRRKMIFIWGDSYAAALYQGLLSARNAAHDDYGISQMTDGNGPPFFNVPGRTDEGKSVSQANVDRLEAVAEHRPDVVVITWLVFGSNAPHDKAQALAMLGSTVQRIKAVSPLTEVVVVGPVPHWNGNLSSKVISYWKRYKKVPPEYMSYGLNGDIAPWDDYLKLHVPSTGASYVSALEVLCEPSGCLTRIGNDIANLPAVDFGHLSKQGSVYLVDKIQSEIFLE